MHNKVKKSSYGLENFPVNPLEEKWKILYPMDDKCENMKEEYLPCNNCGKCPKGYYFKVPKEDLILFRKYLKDCREYLELHNPYKAKVMKKTYDNKKIIENES